MLNSTLSRGGVDRGSIQDYNVGGNGGPNLTNINTEDFIIQNTTNFPLHSETTDFSYSDFWPFISCEDNDTVGCNESLRLTNISMLNETGSFNGTLAEEGLEYRYWTLFLLTFPFFTVFGNVLVVMSVYRERSLRTATNYFICSLAVADIMVAVMVMPLAVYMEVVQMWLLSAPLCDAWVASDVMACTASILNLTAISVDRFIAVTQPIKYAKHKNSKRVFVTLALCWIISVAIAAPIALGVNYSDLRKPGYCAFFNSDFLICSSMGSFYIPSLIMIFLYWRIYRVLHLRTRAQARSKRARQIKHETSSTNVIANPATVTAMKIEPTVTTGLAKSVDNGKLATYNTNNKNNQTKLSIPITECDDVSVTNVGTNTDSQSSERFNEDDNVPKTPGSDGEIDIDDDNGDEKGSGALIVNRVAVREVEVQIGGNGNGTCNTTLCTENETKFGTPIQRVVIDQASDDNVCIRSPGRKGLPHRRKDKKGGAKFNFHMRTSRKRKEKSSSKREKKATKTLAIVLGVFLFCWVPFFTINIINAICIRYELFSSPMCNIDNFLFNSFVWLGYINSFLNPVIYTIFNPEFRKAFKKILTERC
ncbi:D(2) dopamine receptor-like [Mizuhopecten yessoensis]|uniref:Dopamine D2-like receptor n=1 Tax=Mizuhopecten yessoensis TaxID=6573 RepID=A0A210QF40_MIZYE|nr:D(2) dopamine receptor-like [Mizuhopecten yessoensis]OWF47241.1 Dopamine D2-like receptor [Mizuhopecten yessoensis]